MTNKLPTKSNKRTLTSTTRKKTNKKSKYKIVNWSEYNNSLVKRGSLDFWVEQGIIKSWKVTVIDDGKKKKGASLTYSSVAIETCRMVGLVYHQALRQTQGLLSSIFSLMKISLPVPDYSTLSRRSKHLKVNIPIKNKSIVAMVVDSTGLKLYGEGEWKVKKHGTSKHRRWLKYHISIDKDGEIRAVKLTNNNITDETAGVALIKEQTQYDSVSTFNGDGAYDRKQIYQLCLENDIGNILIPPQKNAKIWFHGNKHGPPHPRDQNLRTIRKTTRRQWKNNSGYHGRSLVENTMFRRKTIFGDRVHSKTTKGQLAEVLLTTKALNLMLYNGMPRTIKVT